MIAHILQKRPLQKVVESAFYPCIRAILLQLQKFIRKRFQDNKIQCIGGFIKVDSGVSLSMNLSK